LVIDPAHHVPLASGLVAKALAALGRDPKLLVLTEVRPTRATTIQVLEFRGFEEISRWHWLGLRLDRPS
jgi:hypothetical protein